MNKAPKLIIVSNRLPVTASLERKKVSVKTSMGGLATGLDPVRKEQESVWVGWPGDTAKWSDEHKDKLRVQLEEIKCLPVFLTAKEVRGFYLEFSNGVLWPLYHYMPSLIPLEMQGWDAYQQVNRRFAEEVASVYTPGDKIWVHDFQLSLVPQMLRDMLPEANIGYFLHIPFPSSDIFRILPCREELLRGMLGANTIGFHTTGYANNFASAVLRVTGCESKMNLISYDDGRTVDYGCFPMGIDVDGFAAEGSASPISSSLDSIRQSNEGVKLLLAVDRLDYTKGIPRRLLAYERMLELHPEMRGKVILIQVAVPSRSEVVAYEENKRSVDEIVGRINGRFGAPGYHPIHYFATGFNQAELIQMYRGVDAMIVTPLRDGMNLVAKEFCASRTDERGVLVLSEFAGAAAEMGEAVIVNPFDLTGTANAYATAIQMDPEEQTKRMRALRARIKGQDHRSWSKSFLGRMTDQSGRDQLQGGTVAKTQNISAEGLADLCKGRPLALFLDYDGTLVPITKVPELATPDRPLRELLKRLLQHPDLYVAIVSGRSQEALSDWLGDLPVHLFAEHAAWERMPEGPWNSHLNAASTSWMKGVRDALDRITSEVPGSFVEEKSHSLVWHHRMADPEHAEAKARELHFQLVDLLANLPVRVSSGKKIVEVRASGIDKSHAIRSVSHHLADAGYLMVALGDDATDEDMFNNLPEDGLSVHVGGNRGVAAYNLRNVLEVRKFLNLLADRPLLGTPPAAPTEVSWSTSP
ncbi:MAG: bifunctional alpha,alpha-trehalose-phosphate synthase (UDP-forming)/trehalose-phosphatase [Proteobacteria bacterium]|nr:bifunctional alpha,alpha-trehalose-phosphate synthase (UDP-forming)/trehalose-phosphatase [Pseudomonadota bacterium]